MKPAKRGGKAPNKPETRRDFNLKWPDSILEDVRKRAHREGLSVSAFLRRQALAGSTQAKNAEANLIKSVHKMCRAEPWMSEGQKELLAALSGTMTELVHHHSGHPPARLWERYVVQVVRLRMKGRPKEAATAIPGKSYEEHLAEGATLPSSTESVAEEDPNVPPEILAQILPYVTGFENEETPEDDTRKTREALRQSAQMATPKIEGPFGKYGLVKSH